MIENYPARKTVYLIWIFILCSNLLFSQQYTMVWNEEFDSDGLPDLAKWSFEEGHVRNKEKQYYTVNDTDNCIVKNGVLHLIALHEKIPNKAFVAQSDNWKTQYPYAAYSSASIHTFQKASFQFGKIEVRAALPSGLGTWPAIWLVGTNRDEVGWPACGEIDLMEFIGRDSLQIFGTVHFPDHNKKGYSTRGDSLKLDKPPYDFHVYSLEWTNEDMQWFVDGVAFHQVKFSALPEKARDVFTQPFYLILNLALGGKWAGEINNDQLPQEFKIDYVRIYQKK